MKRQSLILITIIIAAAIPCPHAAAESLVSGAPWITQTVDGDHNVGQDVSIAVDPDTSETFVVYYDVTDADLRLAFPVLTGGDCGPNNSWKCLTLDSEGDVGRHNSVDIRSIDGGAELFIAYHDATNRALKYMRVMWTTTPAMITAYPSTIDAPTGAFDYRGTQTSIRLDNDDLPRIAYRVTNLAGDDSLIVARLVTPTLGNCGPIFDWQCDTVVVGEGVGMDPSLAINGWNASLVASHNIDTGRLLYSVNSAGSWSTTEISRGSNDVGQDVSLYIDASEEPHLAYFNATTSTLEYAHSVGFNSGNCGTLLDWQCDVIDLMPASPGVRAVAISGDAEGHPIIAYQDDESGLSLARPTASMGGILSPNCGPENGLFQTWHCESLDEGFLFTNEGSGIAIDTDATGLARIAYQELSFGIPPSYGILKVAKEDRWLFTDGFESGNTSGWSDTVN